MQYMVKKVDMRNVKSVDDYLKASDNATIKYCNGLKEVIEYCGGKLHRERNGYAGFIGDIEYFAVKV